MTDRAKFADRVVRRRVSLPRAVKERLRGQPLVQRLWTVYRERQVLREYRRRREHYAARAADRGIVYSEARTRREVRERLAQRGYSPIVRKRGEVHTFAVFPSYGWHRHLLPDLSELGSVTHFDYEALGYSAEAFMSNDAKATARRGEMVQKILPALRRAHLERPVDWLFWYGGGQDVDPDVVRGITEELGIPVVNMSLDDKQGWAGASAGRWRTGAVDITSAFDLYMTSARVACEWHMVEGGRPLYRPEGFDASAYAPSHSPRDIPVSFVGAGYGFRLAVGRYLHRQGVDFRPFGAGWPAGRVDDVVSIFNRSVINLGMGGIEYSEELTNVKGRDFEIPGTGGGMYLTSFNPDLAQHFGIGEDILCYRNRDEMLELIRYYLARPEEAAAIASRARERSLRAHRWLHRYEAMLRVLGVMAEA